MHKKASAKMIGWRVDVKRKLKRRMVSLVAELLHPGAQDSEEQR
jgi:hypothetical protein